MGFTGLVASAVGGVARLRQGSAIHEFGTAYTGWLHCTGGGPGPFGQAGGREVAVRWSRGLGLPAALPDVVGLGIRLTTDRGHQDLLLDSCGAGRLGRHVPALRRSLTGGPLGTLLALHDGAHAFHLLAVPRAAGPVRDPRSAQGLVVVLAVASPFGGWVAVGALRTGALAVDQSLRMSPAHAALGLRVAPGWERFRAASYASSRRSATR